MNVEIIKIKGISYLINFDTMTIRVFNDEDNKEVHKYLVQKHKESDKFNMPEKYNKIYERLQPIEDKKKLK